MLFSPFEMYFDRQLKQEKEKNKFLNNNYRVESKAQQYTPEVIQGSVPTDINGIYVRNGPNPVVVPDNGRHHWFDGDGMLHATRIFNGKVQFCGKMTETPKYLSE